VVVEGCTNLTPHPAFPKSRLLCRRLFLFAKAIAEKREWLNLDLTLVNPDNKPMQEKHMKDLASYAAYYLEKLKGADSDAAYKSLIAADHTIVPLLIKAYRTESIPTIRATLAKIIWQHRIPETISFLSEALGDNHPEVWKNALDGFVALGDLASVQTLESAKQHIQLTDATRVIKTDWINEAIQRIRNGSNT
jgi:hypothetical protein